MLFNSSHGHDKLKKHEYIKDKKKVNKIKSTYRLPQLVFISCIVSILSTAGKMTDSFCIVAKRIRS